MKKIFTLFLVFMTSIPIVLSHDFTIEDVWSGDGYHDIYFNYLGGDSVEVTYYYDKQNPWRKLYYARSITIPKVAYSPYRVTTIGKYAFSDCDFLESVEIPNSVTSIEEYAFKDSYRVRSITIPNSVTSIGAGAFDGTRFYYNMPDGPIYINNVFYEDKNGNWEKDTLEIREGTVSISDYALGYNNKIKCVIIPNSLVKIGRNMFSGCTKLSSIIVKSDNKVYDSRDNCNAIIETATNTLVYGISNSKIPTSVTSIGESAFEDCNLSSITIPNSVTSIGSNAFNYCDNLSSIYCFAKTPPTIGSGAFDDDYVETIYVPKSSIDDYKSKWSSFSTKIKPMSSYGEFNLISNTLTTAIVEAKLIFKEEDRNINVGYILNGDTIYHDCEDSVEFTITGLRPNNNEVTFFVGEKDGDFEEYLFTQKTIITSEVKITASSNIQTQATVNISVNCDFTDWTPGDYGVILTHPNGISDTIKFEPNQTDTIVSNLSPNTEYSYLGFCKVKEYDDFYFKTTTETFKTKDISMTPTSIYRTQTTMRIGLDYDFGDATLIDKGIIVYHPTDVIDTISFEGERKDTLLTNLRVYDKYIIKGYVKTKEGELKLSGYGQELYTKNINASLTISNRTQTTMSVSASIDLGDAKDYGKNGIHWIIGSSSFNDNYIEIFFDEGVYNLDTTFTDLSTEITCAFRVFYQGEDNGEEYYAYGSTRSSKTLPITLNEPELVDVGQTFIEVSSNNIYGDATLFGEYIEVTTNKDKTSEYKVDINGRNKIIINNLDPFTRYYFRSVLTTKEDGTMRSEWHEAKTKAISLSTGIADGISNSSAFLHGTIECDSLSRTEIGFEWKRSDAPSTVKPQRLLVVDRIDENLLFRLEGLSSDHYYDFRTFCYYNDKSYYGEWVGFLTSDKEVLIAPSVSTLKAESSELGVEMKGFIVAGTEVILQRGFECWRDGTDVVATTVAEGSVINSFIPEPWSYTTYKYRAYAKTPAGTTYGETLEVTTEYIKTKIPEIAIKPSSNSAKVTWKNVEQADYYMLSLYDDPSMTNSRGIYTVDKYGNIAQKRSTSSVVTCNLTDLLPDTNYYFAVKAYNSSDQMVAEETGTFETTPMETPIDEVEADEDVSDVKSQKILYNGHIYIIYDGQVYNILGEEVNLQFCR